MPKYVEYVDINHDGVLTTTEMARLFDIDGEEVWVPKSLTEYWDEDAVDGHGTFTVPAWFAEKEELI